MAGDNAADVEVLAVIKARNEASDEMQEVTSSTEGMERGFAGLNLSMLTAGLGALGMGASLSSLVDTNKELAVTSANATLTAERYGGSQEDLLEELRKAAPKISEDYARTANDVEKAWTAMVIASDGAVTNIDDVTAALGLAALAGVDVETAGTAIGLAIAGDVTQLEAMVGRVTDVRTEMDTLAESGAEVSTKVDDIQATFKQFWEDLFLVDTGATDSMVPRNHLDAIGLKPKGSRVYELADGSELKLDITVAEIEFMGEIVGGTIIYDEEGTEPILGVTALESVGIEVDPNNQRLKRLPAVRLKTIRPANRRPLP